MANINVSLEDCPAESTLAEDVTNENGVIVLKAGVVLDETKIANLARYGINDIVIISTTKLSPAELAEKKKRIGKHIDKRLRKCEMTDEMIELRDILIKHHCQEL